VSDDHKKLSPGDFRIPENSPWAQAWKMAAAVGGIGLVCAAAGYSIDHRRFAFAYLTGFVTVLTIAFGSMFFVLIQHLSSAGWSVSVRRASEFFIAGTVIIPLLALPNLLSLDQLYPWWQHGAEEHVAHAQEHTVNAPSPAAPEKPRIDPDAEVHSGPEHAIEEATLAKKLPYLNHTFFFIRAIVYLLVWLGLARYLFGNSTQQDVSGDPKLTVRLQRRAPVATILFAFSLTFAGFDWIMSLAPNWYSTMFGVRIFAASAVLSFALNILVSLGFYRTGVSKDTITVEHFHDLGKLMFAFLIFWAYISFSEFFLIWYAAIPEETVYFHMRWDTSSWRAISVALVTIKFIIPFFLVMSRNAKRNLGLLGLGAGWIVTMHLVEMYYWIMPHFQQGDVAFSLTGFVTDLGCMFACVGLYLAVVFRRMLNHPVIPVRDPRLQRAIDFVNA
jgi:hypothetical protein